MGVVYQLCRETNQNIFCIGICYNSSTKVMSLKLPLSKSFSLTLLVNIDMSKHSMPMLVYYQIHLLLFYTMILVYVSVKERLYQMIFLTFSSAFFDPLIHLSFLFVPLSSFSIFTEQLEKVM